MISFVGQAARSIVGAAFAVLLMLAAVTPAFAELGCFEDRVEHTAEVNFSDADHVSAPAEPTDDQNGPLGQVKHCAFSHCAHGFAPGSLQNPAANGEYQSVTFPVLEERRTAAAHADGPYHPPRA